MEKNYYDILKEQCRDLTIDEIEKIIQRDSFCQEMEECYFIIKEKNKLRDKEFDEYRKDHMWLEFQLRQLSMAEVRILDELKAKFEASESISYYTYAAISNIKEGDVRIDGKELQMLICVALDYFYCLAEVDNHLKIERDAIELFLGYIEKKYLKLSDIRLEEKKRFSFFKQMKSEQVYKWWMENGYEYKQLEEHQRDAYEQYLDCKIQREELARKIEKWKKESFWNTLMEKYKIIM